LQAPEPPLGNIELILEGLETKEKAMDEAKQRFSIEVETVVDAGPQDVWALLTDAIRLGDLFWGSKVEGDFAPGSLITWKGTWDGKPFEDRGRVRRAEQGSRLEYTHWTVSSSNIKESDPNLLCWELRGDGRGTRVRFRHDNIATAELRDHSEPMWKQLLARLKDAAERSGART
jgi:uncharacterized protein YndB with AHSA1/START domain